MSLFIGQLAFAGDARALDTAKIAVLVASLLAGALGAAYLRFVAPAARDEAAR